MKRNTKSNKIVNKSKEIKSLKHKILFNLVCLAFAIFISYSSSILLILFFSVEKIILGFSQGLFILSLLVLFFIFKNIILIKLPCDKDNLKIYLILGIILLLGVIITFKASSYYMELYFKTSVFDTNEYLKNYDLKAKDVIKTFLPITFGMGLLVSFIYNVYLLKRKGKRFLKYIISALYNILGISIKLVAIYLITSFLGFIIFAAINMSGGAPFGG